MEVEEIYYPSLKSHYDNKDMNQYEVVPPLAAIHCLHRLRMLIISLLIVHWGIALHSWRSTSDSSCIVCGALFRRAILLDIMSHTCSMGFKSGDRAGHSITSIVSSRRYCLVTLAVCGCALSCIRIKSWPIAPAKGLTMGWTMSFTYLIAVRLPLSTTTSSVRPWMDIPPQTITDPPPKRSCWTMLHCAYRSPGCRHTLTRRSHVEIW